jgi:N-dimethylarginine dimethylaminohydrolase
MHSVHVKDEFAPLKVVIVHDGTNAITLSMEEQRRLIPAEDLQKHPEAGPVFKERLIEQQAEFLKLLAFHGVTLLYPATQPTAFCQVFTRDPCFAIGDTHFLGSLRDAYRHPEMGGLTGIGQQVSKVAALWGGSALIEGGDVMPLKGGREVLVGMNQHTNDAGLQNLAAQLAGSGATVVKVLHRALHLDCCLAPLPDGDALYAPDKLPEETQAFLRGHFRELIPLDREEAALHLAANLLWLDEKNVVSGRATRNTNELLRSRNYQVHEIDFAPHVCLWGSFRCVTCPIVRG